MMQLGCDGVFVGSGIFKDAKDREHAASRARAIVKAVANWTDKQALIEASIEHGSAMAGISNAGLKPEEKMAGRGW
jgi:Pyridoxine biosynthesis enzyme